MARDAIPITALVTGDGIAQGAGVAISATNGGKVSVKGRTRRIVLHIKATSAGGTITVQEGVYPPAFRQGIGDVVKVVAGTTETLFVLESARHTQADGDVWVDYQSGFAGTAFAYELPNDV